MHLLSCREPGIETSQVLNAYHMAIQFKLYAFVLSCYVAYSTSAQDEHVATLNVGDVAPPLRVREWLKGTPVSQLENGKIYLLEFWATWCRPCIAEMPHLSKLARKYRDKITVISVDIFERETTTIQAIRAFVDSMGYRMDYNVAADDSNFMASAWINALADPSIPHSFIINAEGKLAWTGHPSKLDEVLPAIVYNTWEVEEALEKRNLNLHLQAEDREVVYRLLPFVNNDLIPNHPLRPDSVFSIINEIVAKEPGLKYAPFIAYYTFTTLLHTDLQKAYEYGKAAIVTPTYDEPAWYSIFNAIELYGDKLNLPPSFFLLGVETAQAMIDHVPYPELVNLPRMYKRMAAFYWCANEQTKAIEALEKGIEIMKNRKDFNAKELAEMESRLQQYAPAKKAF